MAVPEGLGDGSAGGMGLCSGQQQKTLQMPVITEVCASPPEHRWPTLR